jgi:hypothetical protein
MKTAFALLTALTFATAAFAVETGKPAPDFTGTDINGKTVKLSDYAKERLSSSSPTIPTARSATTNTRLARCRKRRTTSLPKASCGCW